MDRRTTIKTFLAITAGVTLLPSCMQDKTKAAILLKNFKIDTGHEQLLEELSETIIPKTTSPGAKDLGAHLFALMMIDECVKIEDQEKFVKGMRQFDALCKKEHSNSFPAMTSAQRNSILADIESKKNSDEDITSFYRMIKRFTVQSYTSSKYYLTSVQVYEMAPGRFHGCVPVAAKIS